MLADCVLRIGTPRPSGPIDPVTMRRGIAADTADSPAVPAVVEDDETASGPQRARRRAWIVRIADLAALPAPDSMIRQDQGGTWRVLRVARMTDGRDLRIVGERMD